MKENVSARLRTAIDDSTIHIERAQDLDRVQLAEILNGTTFAIVSGIIDADAVRSGKKQIQEQFDSARDRAATGEHPSEIMDNFQKLSVGGAEHSGVYRPRCMRTLYNPVWAEDIYGLRESFRELARLRNMMYGFHLDYAIDDIEGGFWTAARIHHYPAGGGFLVSHLDNVVPIVQKAEGISTYFQPVLVMSTRGEGDEHDFTTGGGFFEYEGERFFYEEHCNVGDVVIYSGATVHGVDDIDIHKPFDSTSISGRMGGFVTLYRHFERKNQLADYIPEVASSSDGGND